MTRKRRILVVGADEFIGRRVTVALASSDWAVPVTEVVDRVRPVTNDVKQPTTNDATMRRSPSLLTDIDGVVNCRHGHPNDILRAAESLAVSLRTEGRIPVVHLSSMAVYGQATGVVEEDAPVRPGLGAYSNAQIKAEELARANPLTTIFRLGCVYGSDCRQWSDRIADLLLAGRLGDLGAAGDGRCNLIHLDDVATAVLTALTTSSAAGQTFNLGMTRPPTWNEYFIRFAKVLKAVPVRRITRRRLTIESKVVAPPAKLIEKMSSTLRLDPSSTMASITPGMLTLWKQDITLSMRRADRLLPWRGRSLDDGLREYARSRAIA